MPRRTLTHSDRVCGKGSPNPNGDAHPLLGLYLEEWLDLQAATIGGPQYRIFRIDIRVQACGMGPPQPQSESASERTLAKGRGSANLSSCLSSRASSVHLTTKRIVLCCISRTNTPHRCSYRGYSSTLHRLHCRFLRILHGHTSPMFTSQLQQTAGRLGCFLAAHDNGTIKEIHWRNSLADKSQT